MVLTAVAAAVTILLPYTSFGQTVFSFTPPSLVSLAIILGLVGAFFVCVELVNSPTTATRADTRRNSRIPVVSLPVSIENTAFR